MLTCQQSLKNYSMEQAEVSKKMERLLKAVAKPSMAIILLK
jgi:hypothetical protein